MTYIIADAIPIGVVAVGLLFGTIIVLAIILRLDNSMKKDIVGAILIVSSIFLTLKDLKDDKKNEAIKSAEKIAATIGAKKSKRIPHEENLEHPGILVMFLLAMSCSALYVFAVFWDSFLIDRRQDNCIEGLDCYLISSKVALYTPLNCSEHEMEEVPNKSMSVICYRFVLNIGRAWANAGGAIAVSATGVMLSAAIFNKIATTCFALNDKCSFCCIQFLQLVAGGVLYCLTVVPSLVTTILDKKKQMDIPKFAYIIILFFQVFFIANIPWYLAYKDEEKTKNKNDRIKEDDLPTITHWAWVSTH